MIFKSVDGFNSHEFWSSEQFMLEFGVECRGVRSRG